jgi:hypothetical protein
MTTHTYNQKKIGDKVIRQRVSDGYLSATDMCKANGKLYGNYIATNPTKEYLKELSLDMKLPVPQLVEVKRGGRYDQQGTWVHPRVATHLAMWLSPKFAVKVSKWVEEWTLCSETNARTYLNELENLEVSRTLQKEKALNNFYKEALGARSEVNTDVGYIDLLTDTLLIEIKAACTWKHGLGQLICYGRYYPHH